MGHGVETASPECPQEKTVFSLSVSDGTLLYFVVCHKNLSFVTHTSLGTQDPWTRGVKALPKAPFLMHTCILGREEEVDIGDISRTSLASYSPRG